MRLKGEGRCEKPSQNMWRRSLLGGACHANIRGDDALASLSDPRRNGETAVVLVRLRAVQCLSGIATVRCPSGMPLAHGQPAAGASAWP